MSNSLKRAHLRMQGVDIEVTAVGEATDSVWKKPVNIVTPYLFGEQMAD